MKEAPKYFTRQNKSLAYFGGEAGQAIINGQRNTIIGNLSGKLITGDQNITIGAEAGDNITSGDGNVIIGSINADSATGDNQLIIADGVDGSVAWITGDSNGVVTSITQC